MKIIEKFFIFFAFLFVFTAEIFCEGFENQKKFVRGNIIEKTAAVKNSFGDEAVVLSKAAIKFSIDNKEILGEDRDLAALCVAGVLSIPTEYILQTNDEERKWFFDSFYKIYSSYADPTVEIAVLNKISYLKDSDYIFTNLLNNFLKSRTAGSEDSSLLKTVILTLGQIGNDESFMILYSLSSDESWKVFEKEINESLVLLSASALDCIISIIGEADFYECRKIISLIEKNDEISNVFKTTIAENVLSRTIYISESLKSVEEALVKLQLDSYEILVNLNWTRGENTVLLFYETAKKLYEEKFFGEDQFIQVILGLKSTVPLKAVPLLCDYLTQINKRMEENTAVSEKLVLSIIQTLGAIGDKNAFDTLLAVTYYTYSDTVISSARDALARLKW